jgi:hypothetical protein
VDEVFVTSILAGKDERVGRYAPTMLDGDNRRCSERGACGGISIEEEAVTDLDVRVLEDGKSETASVLSGYDYVATFAYRQWGS